MWARILFGDIGNFRASATDAPQVVLNFRGPDYARSSTTGGGCPRVGRHEGCLDVDVPGRHEGEGRARRGAASTDFGPATA